MPKGKTAAPAPVKVTGEAGTKARKEARRQAQDKREAANRLGDDGELTPWGYSKALRAERRKGLPMSTETRKRLDREKKAEASKAERDSDAKNKSSASQARRNASMIADALARKNGAVSDARPARVVPA